MVPFLMIVLRVLDLSLQNADKPHRAPRCEELERQRKIETCPSSGHGSAKTPGSHPSPRHANQEKSLDITMILAHPVAAQDGVMIIPGVFLAHN